MHSVRRIFTLVLLSVTTLAYSQQSLKGWHLLDFNTDKYNGISLNRAYDFLKGKKGKPVIVAVIDGGIDTTHEDLKNVVWTNPKELSGNGIDDDGNGYVDDIHGWNFLGGKDGRNVAKASREASRIYHSYKGRFSNRSLNVATLADDEKALYSLWKRASELVEVKHEDKVESMFLDVAYKAARKNEKILKGEIKKEEFTIEEVENFMPVTQQGKRAKYAYLTFVKIFDLEKTETNNTIFTELQAAIEEKKDDISQKDTPPSDERNVIVRDNYSNINDRFYGNNDVMGPTPLHGTHVGGIIGAQRNNGLGIDGIADNVKLMVIRAVPDGDEYDKDIALAIRYAVDNGAKVINMSFGKEISPQKMWVDDAVRYAETKDVLIVHAAGNEAENNDSVNSFPSPELTTLHMKASNFITVGASSDPAINNDYVADFSNYGRSSVDVFAPGIKIYSTVPGNHACRFEEGTSMAAPVVSGVAALIRSYFPELTAKQVKYVLTKSVNVLDSTVKVTRPGTKEKVSLASLCSSGGWVNAYNAIKLAANMANEKPEVQRKEVKKDLLPKSTFQNSLIKQ